MSVRNVVAWRNFDRPVVLRRVARQMRSVQWTQGLLEVLLDELHISHEVAAILGNDECLKTRCSAGTVALAIALRHSWRPDDLSETLTRLDRVDHRTRLNFQIHSRKRSTPRKRNAFRP